MSNNSAKNMMLITNILQQTYSIHSPDNIVHQSKTRLLYPLNVPQQQELSFPKGVTREFSLYF